MLIKTTNYRIIYFNIEFPSIVYTHNPNDVGTLIIMDKNTICTTKDIYMANMVICDNIILKSRYTKTDAKIYYIFEEDGVYNVVLEDTELLFRLNT